MKVFVCYGQDPYDGRSRPKAVFLSQLDADKWCIDKESQEFRLYESYEWEELEVQE